MTSYEIYNNILITGGCGFIGSHFINQYYQKTNSNIINIDALYNCSNKENISEHIRNDTKRYLLYPIKLQNLEFVSHILEIHNINQVIHFAAQSHVQNSFESSLQFTDDNVFGTHVLLEACRKYGKIKKFIHCSTDEVYGETSISDSDTKKESSSLLCPTNPYAASKAAAELFAISYWKSFKLPVIITRGNNVFGPNQYPEKVIPKFIDQLFNNKQITIQGDGSAVRGFLYIDDVVSAFITVLNKGVIGEIYNIGSDDSNEISISELAKLLISKIVPKKEDAIKYIDDRPFNDHRYYISSSKLRDLGWKPETKFVDGLDKVIESYMKKNFKYFD